MISRVRCCAQAALKSVARSLGLEIRYAFQNPPISSASLYRRWLRSEDAQCIFDVGANIGEMATAFVMTFPNAMVHSFEPFPAPFQQLATTARKFKGRIKPWQLALGDEEHAVTTGVDPSSRSKLNTLGPGSGGSTVQVATLDAFCIRERIASIDILKTDTEGYDARVLRGASRMLSDKRIRCIVSEVGFVGDRHHTPFEDVYCLLRASGYQLAGLYEASYFRSGECDFANALFCLGGHE
jgi:FkbM family methyltransferase